MRMLAIESGLALYLSFCSGTVRIILSECSINGSATIQQIFDQSYISAIDSIL
jgi:hypothetical protein